MATLVQIKRSSANATPSTLTEGELAYSYLSNTLFIGDSSNAAINIGGNYYTTMLDNRTSANSGGTIVVRAANGSAQFSQLDILLAPTANSHVATKEYVDQVALGEVTLASLNDVSLPAGNAAQDTRMLIGNADGIYVATLISGNVTISNTGVVTIGTGQVTNSMLEGSISNDKLSQDSITVTAGAGLGGGGTVSLGNTITLDVVTGDGLSNTGDVVAVDGTVVRTDRNQTVNGVLSFSNTVYFNNDINVTGNIYLNGNTTYINVSTLNVSDPLIYLAANNDISDTVDIGFMGGKNTAGQYSHTGLIRHAQDGNWYLFDGLVEEGHQNNIVDVANTTYALLKANLEAKSLLVTGAGSAANINATLEVTGNTTLKSNLAVSGNLTVSGGDIRNADGSTLIQFNGADVRLPNTSSALDVYSGEVRVQGTTFLQATGQDVEVKGDLTVSGGDIISTAVANLLNVTTTTLNLGGAATDVKIGALTGNTTVNHNLIVAENSEANVFISNRTTTQAPSLSNFNGERLRLFDFDVAGRPNYAIGVEGNHIWTGVDSSANSVGFKWYGNTSLAMRLSGNGVLEVANTINVVDIFATSLTLSTPLGVGSGGTGLSSFTPNGVFFADTSSSLSFATGTDGEVLQITAGVPTFGMLDGGSF